MKRIRIVLAALMMLSPFAANANIIIEYYELGPDLRLAFSGSLNTNEPGTVNTATLVGIGNQGGGVGATTNPIFYSSGTGYSYWGRFTGVTASAASFWGAGVSPDYTGNTAIGDTLMIRYNSASGQNSVDLWGTSNYVANAPIQGTLTAAGYSIASSGITDWTVDLGAGIGSVSIQAQNAVPEPGTLALFGIGLIGFCTIRRRRIASMSLTQSSAGQN